MLLRLNLLFLVLLAVAWGCRETPTETQWKGQDPIQKISTRSLPVERQWKGVFDLGSGLYCSNDFEGARLNGAIFTHDTIIALITPEVTPVNESPWYAFKVWSDTAREIAIKLTYLDGYRHRYYPKLSRDGVHWTPLDSARYTALTVDTANNTWHFPDAIAMRLPVDRDTLWISAQELVTSTAVQAWCDTLALLPFVEPVHVGTSGQGRPINGFRIGTGEDKQMVMLISRQHPPEVTGYFALQAFVESLCGEDSLATAFRNHFTTYVVPLMNPDGVDGGYWRSNAGGRDTNRDWEDFNQPEPRALKAFMQQKVGSSGGKFFLGIDFHSTWEDIFYIFKPDKKGYMPGLVPEILEAMDDALPGYTANINRGLVDTPRVSSSGCFFYDFGAESFTYEIGDNTPRDFVRRKGAVTAVKTMEIMLRRMPQ